MLDGAALGALSTLGAIMLDGAALGALSTLDAVVLDGAALAALSTLGAIVLDGAALAALGAALPGSVSSPKIRGPRSTRNHARCSQKARERRAVLRCGERGGRRGPRGVIDGRRARSTRRSPRDARRGRARRRSPRGALDARRACSVRSCSTARPSGHARRSARVLGAAQPSRRSARVLGATMLDGAALAALSTLGAVLARRSSRRARRCGPRGDLDARRSPRAALGASCSTAQPSSPAPTQTR
ncbi:hypothetical protein [Polyangium spumosum]|uniref:Uncharacterized protein n=1 Tax=Polyangium spumosum TaxID=889282 RepID=A0A6N7Q2D8_9BACT|nr:hypothetical protein [Polyangium spumosum]MRG98498.1 hypothetical protein [Polyangium spumosum]